MKTQTKMIFSAALAAALITLPRAHALTGGTAQTNAVLVGGSSSNAPAATATSTNSKPADVMAALFGDPVIAKGKGFEIKQSQLDEVLNTFKNRAAQMGQTIPQEDMNKIEQNALNTLIGTQILLQKATDADKAQGKKDADQNVAQAVKRLGSRERLEVQLKVVGKTFDDWRAQMTEQTTATAVMIRELNAAPKETEVKKYYDDNPKASEMPEQAHVRHILLLTIDPATRAPLADDRLKAKKKQADDILKQARAAGADFAKLAKDYSEDPGSKDNGGELPPFARASADPSHAMVPEFEAASFSLTNNQISDVVTTQFGYHIIQLLDKTPARKMALADKLPLGDSTLADEIKNFLTGQKLQELAPAYIEKLSKSPGVEILDPALKALFSAQTNAPVEPAAAPKP
ncbi:MAG: peptidylprolyl isomerase [Verrucomicrobiota bacterium]